MTLKKPTDFFSDGEDENNTINGDVSNIDELIKKPELKSFSESFDVYKNNLEKFQNFSQTIESIESIKKEFQDFLTKEDLDNAMVAYSFLLEESISKVKNDFVEIEIPKKYNKITVESELRALKHYQKFKEELDVLIEDVKQNKIFLDDTFSNFEEKIDNIKEDKIYQLDKIYNVNKLEEENSKLFNKINSLEEKINDVKNDKTYELDKIYDVGKLEEKIDDIKEDKIYQVDKIEEENYKLSKKIKYIEEVFEKFNERNILNESIVVEPPNSNNSDPLTPLDKNYVTFKELENHYRLFVNRIQQQLSTFGGGGETQLKYLDDIVGIATNASAFDGKFLKYTHSIGKFEFVTVSGGGGSGTPGGSDGQIQYNNGGAFGGATQLFYDDSNNRVGINSATPTEVLDVIGSVKATDFNTTSDQNLKDNIKTIENPLSKVLSIRGVNFEWKDSNKASAGVIAQEVEKVLPELVTGQNTKTVNYNGLIGLLIETVKEQQKQIDTLSEKISKLE